MKARPVMERLMAKVVKDPVTGCWNWMGSTKGAGYGNIGVGKRPNMKSVRTHRVTYEHFVGPVPSGMELDHRCRNRRCCNPDHLRPMTHRENVLIGTSPIAEHANKTHCIRGHPLGERGTGGEERICLVCARKRAAEQRERQAQPGGSRANCFVPRKTHCIRGHALVEGNLIISRAGRRCRQCVNEKTLAAYHARKNRD